MRRSTIKRREAVLKQLERSGLRLESGDPIRLNFGVLRAMRATCPGALALLLLCAPLTGRASGGLTPIRGEARGEMDLVAYCLYQEARGEGYKGTQAVASVIYNRAVSKCRPFGVVVTRRAQFSGMAGIRTAADIPPGFIDGRDIVAEVDRVAWYYCYLFAERMCRGGFVPSGYWTHFYNPDLCSPSWAHDLRDTRTIGRHIFGTMRENRW